MNWIQQNKRLAAILGIMIAGGLGLGYMLYSGWSDYSAAQGEWESKSRDTTKMENSKVYPSAANVKALDQEIADYRGEFKLLRLALLDPASQRPIKPLSETEFQAKVKERTKAVLQKADEFGIKKLPPNFALGFEEYSGKLPLNAEAAAELNIHLEVMEAFIMTLVDARVESIDQLQRFRLSCEDQKTPGTTTAGQRPAVNPTPAANAEQVLDRYTIKCNFTTDQRQLETVMNNLSNAAKTNDFLAVRLMRVENEKTEAPTRDEIRAAQRNNSANDSSATSSVVDPRVRATNIIAPPKPLPADARTIIGGEILKVYLEVDYIRFRQPPPENALPPKR
jgi:hypothetical protein